LLAKDFAVVANVRWQWNITNDDFRDPPRQWITGSQIQQFIAE